ncbi:MAG: hypothetical protein HC784_06840 [Hydrococcus sp. CSU_1_8]|nr:hypothetical protein [Hydrococcus sp. CSU_1_8]
MEDGDTIGTLRGHVSDISAIAIAPDNQTLVSVSSAIARFDCGISKEKAKSKF